MSVKTRAAWMDHIDTLKVPDHVKRDMQDFVHRFDSLLGSVIGNIHLTYLRNKQEGKEDPDG